MIHAFGCKNFYSFAEEVTVNFQVNNEKPKNNGSFLTENDNHLSKMEMVIGPNASGKTNLLKVLPFLKWVMINSFEQNPSDPIPVLPFLSKQNDKMPIEVYVVFELESIVYDYRCTLSPEQILEESLHEKSVSKKNITTKRIYERKWDPKERGYIFHDDRLKISKNFTAIERKNASVLSAALHIEHPLSKKLSEYWETLETNVYEAGWAGSSLISNHSQAMLADAFLAYSQNDQIKKSVEQILSKYDLGIESFDIDLEEKDNKTKIEVNVNHKFDNCKFSLPFHYQSAGTKQLFIILKAIFKVLDKGGIAVIDEFDVNLHPDIIYALYELFISPESNPKNAQLLFSSHSFSILSELDKYQIVLIEKNNNGNSEAWRLDEMEGVRTDENYYTKYIAGSYGAKPVIG